MSLSNIKQRLARIALAQARNDRAPGAIVFLPDNGRGGPQGGPGVKIYNPALPPEVCTLTSGEQRALLARTVEEEGIVGPISDERAAELDALAALIPDGPIPDLRDPRVRAAYFAPFDAAVRAGR